MALHSIWLFWITFTLALVNANAHFPSNFSQQDKVNNTHIYVYCVSTPRANVFVCVLFICDTYGDKLMFSSFVFFYSRFSHSYRCVGVVLGKCQLYSMPKIEKSVRKKRERNGLVCLGFAFLCRCVSLFMRQFHIVRSNNNSSSSKITRTPLADASISIYLSILYVLCTSINIYVKREWMAIDSNRISWHAIAVVIQ